MNDVRFVSEKDIFYWNDEDEYIILDDGDVLYYGDFVVIEDMRKYNQNKGE